MSLDDSQALDALLSSFRTARKDEPENERPHAYLGPLGQRLILGTLLDRQSPE
jgi:hypothetical protein